MSILWAIAFGICPQRPSHSLFLGGQQMPIEARMAGMFGGFVIGLAYFAAMRRGRAWRMPGNAMSVILISFVVLLGVDGVNAFFFDLRLPHLYTPNLPLRLGTGLITGLTFAGFMLPVFNSTVWQAGLDVSPLTNARELLIGLLLETAYFVATFSGANILLYLLSLIAVGGVPILLGMTGSIAIAILSGRTNRAKHLRHLIPLALGGLLLSALMLGVMSSGRYILFGAGPLEMPPIR